MASTSTNEVENILDAPEDLNTESEIYRCRMYEAKYPDIDQLVVIQVISIGDTGAYVSLLEYDHIEGMIPLTELSNRRIRSFHKLIKVGRIETAIVLRVDKEKGYIDLSKRRVAPEEVAKCNLRWTKSKNVDSIMRRVAKELEVPLIDLNTSFTWKLYAKYGHASDAFKSYMNDPTSVPEIAELPDNFRESLLLHVGRRMLSAAVKLRSEIEVTCFQYEGIDAIRDALTAGIALSTEKVPIVITLYSTPVYVISSITNDKDQGIETMQSALDAISKSITSKGGEMVVKVAPRAVTDRDDKLYQSQLDQLKKEQQETLDAEFD